MNKTRVLCVCLLTFLSHVTFAKDIFVKHSNGLTGHGQLRLLNNKCFAIVPKHLVHDPGTITLISAGGKEDTATLDYEDTDLDLAILRVPSKGICAGARSSYKISDLEDRLNQITTLQLMVATEDGSVSRITVNLKEVNAAKIIFTSVQPGELTQGLSGSALIENGTTFGMMIGFDDRLQVGSAYREDVVEALWNRKMNRGRPCDSGCEVAVSALPKAAQNCQNSGLGQITVTSTCDIAFQLPEGWPVPSFFHVTLSKVTTTFDGVASDTGWSVFNFALSESSSFGAQDILIPALAYGTLTRVQDSLTIDGKMWTLEISGGVDPQSINIRLTPYKNPFR
jgi:hypothetical protein